MSNLERCESHQTILGWIAVKTDWVQKRSHRSAQQCWHSGQKPAGRRRHSAVGPVEWGIGTRDTFDSRTTCTVKHQIIWLVTSRSNVIIGLKLPNVNDLELVLSHDLSIRSILVVETKAGLPIMIT